MIVLVATRLQISRPLVVHIGEGAARSDGRMSSEIVPYDHAARLLEVKV